MSNVRFDLGLLLEMLTYRRPAGSVAETEFIDHYIAPLPDATCDRFGNWHVVIGDASILWSTHTDTVHNHSGRQTIAYDTKTGMIRISRKSKRGRRREDRSNCLGADDTAGVFLAVSMIRAGVSGHYVFHYGEEIGGNGSSDLARLSPEWLAGSRFAIALDRKGYEDVITHQGFSRCCSDAFASSLAEQLNASGLTFSPSDRGLFTDTANYTDLIGECTNLSIGYFDCHTRAETVDVRFLERLLSALCEIDPSALVEDRKPGEPDDTPLPFLWRGNYPAPSSETFPIALVDCEWCGEAFDPDRSFAEMHTIYCSPECETDDYRDMAARLGSTYLDPVYEDVARALLGEKGKA